MTTAPRQPAAFTRFAWFTLGFNLIVILWGVFLRASHSGDGCGQHWLTCQGEVIPSAPQLKTIIEFTHRITTEVAGVLVVIMAIWVLWAYPKRSLVRKTATLSLLFIIFEGIVGGALVLTGNTADNWTPTRPYWTAGHLINTFILLAFLALTPWLAGRSGRVRFRATGKVWLLLAVGSAAILFVGVSGSMAALTTMLFPAASLSEGLAKDFSDSSNYLLRLRISHPILSILTACYLLFLSGWLRSWSRGDVGVRRWSNLISLLLLVQLGFGAATLLMLSPIVMQLGHLLLADAIWISFILMSATYLSSGSAENDAVTTTG